MQDILLIAALIVFVCLGFPVMKRLDRFLNESFKGEEAPDDEDEGTGK